MALAMNSIQYAFDQRVTSLASAVRHDFSAITLYIPETTSRTFKSVILEVRLHDDGAAAASITEFIVGIKLGAVAFDDVTTTQTLTNSNENAGFKFTRDVTSYFVANFGAGSSQTCQAGIQVTGPSTNNHTARLIITYEYSDAATTRVKTVMIPIESGVGNLSTSLAEIGTNQVPNLDSFLPEASKTYRSVYFIVEGITGTSGTTDYQLGLSLDAESEVLSGTFKATLASNLANHRIWRRDDMTTNATHAFKMRSTNSGARFPCQAITLVVTYEYDHSSSTSIMQSLMLPIDMTCFGIEDSTAPHRAQMSIWVPEPDTITLQQSGVYLYGLVGSGTGPAITIKAGAQSNRTYTGYMQAANNMDIFTHRIDSGGAQGAGMTLARGENTLTLVYYNSGNADKTLVGGYVILNYTSGKASGGAQLHNKTLVGPCAFGFANPVASKNSLAISETDYFVWSVGMWYENTDYTSNGAVAGNIKSMSGDAPGGRYSYDLKAYLDGLNQTGVRFYYQDLVELFKRWADDPDTSRLDPKTSRDFSMRHLTASRVQGLSFFYTYHSLTWTRSGTVSAYADADGAGLTVSMYRNDTKNFLGNVVTTAGGAYSFKWFDNVGTLYGVCLENSTHVGASAPGTAS